MYLIKKALDVSLPHLPFSLHPCCAQPSLEFSNIALNHHLDELLFVFPFVMRISYNALALLGMSRKSSIIEYTSSINRHILICSAFRAVLVFAPVGVFAGCHSELRQPLPEHGGAFAAIPYGVRVSDRSGHDGSGIEIALPRRAEYGRGGLCGTGGVFAGSSVLGIVGLVC